MAVKMSKAQARARIVEAYDKCARVLYMSTGRDHLGPAQIKSVEQAMAYLDRVIKGLR